MNIILHLFFTTRKLYKAEFSPSKGFELSYLRDESKEETFCRGGVCIRKKNGLNYVYRFWEDPDKDAVLIDAPEIDTALIDKILEGKVELTIMRGKLFYGKYTARTAPTIQKVSDNIFSIMADNVVSLYSACPSPVIYFKIRIRNIIHAFDTNTMTFLPDLELGVETFGRIIDVRNGNISLEHISLEQRIALEKYLVTAKLPSMNPVELAQSGKPVPPVRQACASLRKPVPKVPAVSSISPHSAGVPSTLAATTIPDTTAVNINKDKIIEELVDNMEKLQADIRNQTTTMATEPPLEGPTCVICIERLPNIIFFDCMHVAVCEECFNEVSNTEAALKNCPNCRKEIKNSSKVFF